MAPQACRETEWMRPAAAITPYILGWNAPTARTYPCIMHVHSECHNFLSTFSAQSHNTGPVKAKRSLYVRSWL